MACKCVNDIKQGTTSYLAVEFYSDDENFNLDNVSKIDFIFKRVRSADAQAIKTSTYNATGTSQATRKSGTNTILVPWNSNDTYNFEPGKVFYMDTKVYMSASNQNPPTPIVELVMGETLFSQS